MRTINLGGVVSTVKIVTRSLPGDYEPEDVVSIMMSRKVGGELVRINIPLETFGYIHGRAIEQLEKQAKEANRLLALMGGEIL